MNQKKMLSYQKKEILASTLMVLIPIILLFSIFTLTKISQSTIVSIPEPEEVSVTETINPLNNVKITAQTAIVRDLNTGKILYAKKETKPRPLASITKILTAVVVAENAKTDRVSISLDDLAQEGNSNLYPGENFNRDDLIDLTLVSSSNDAASALTASVIGGVGSSGTKNKSPFIAKMNSLAREIGMSNSYFYNETGLDNSETIAGSHGSALDVANLFEYVLVNHPELFESTKLDSISVKSLGGFIHTVSNTNDIINELPGIIASKTGTTDLAGGNLAVVIDQGLNRPVVIVVLGSTDEGRFSDVRLLAQKTVEYFKSLD